MELSLAEGLEATPVLTIYRVGNTLWQVCNYGIDNCEFVLKEDFAHIVISHAHEPPHGIHPLPVQLYSLLVPQSSDAFLFVDLML